MLMHVTVPAALSRIFQVGSISATNNSDLSVSSSCFIENEGLIDGVVFLDSQSQFSINTGNFASGNIARLGTCVDAFQESSGTCIFDGVCNGNCLKFPGAACDGLDLIRGIVNIETPSPKGGNSKQPQVGPISSSPTIPDSPAPTEAPVSDPPNNAPMSSSISSLSSFPTSQSSTFPTNSPSSISQAPTDMKDVPLPVLNDLQEANLYSSGIFIRTVVAAVLIIWCCCGTWQCMRKQALKNLVEEIENDKELEMGDDSEKGMEADMGSKETKEMKSNKESTKHEDAHESNKEKYGKADQLKKIRNRFNLGRVKDGLEEKEGHGGTRGNKSNMEPTNHEGTEESNKEMNDEADQSKTIRNWFKLGRVNDGLGEEEENGETKDLLGKVNDQIHGIGDKMNGFGTKLTMKAMKIKAFSLT